MIRATFDENGKVVQILEDGTTAPFERKTNWSRFDAITDEDAEYNALMDPDEEPCLSDEDREIKRTLIDPKAIRTKSEAHAGRVRRAIYDSTRHPARLGTQGKIS